MENRLTDIIQNPDLLDFNDIEILEKEILKYPFVQSFRAVQLLATHRFKEENYAAKLSETAAFTTDKKILYQLIHRDAILDKRDSDDEVDQDLEVKKLEIMSEKEPISKLEKLIATPEAKFQEVKISKPDLPKEIYIAGELNRILFEGEEDFLNEETESIDLEATKEAGTIVIAAKDENSNNIEKVTQHFTTETIINEDEIKAEQNVLENGSQISFHGVDENLKVKAHSLEDTQKFDTNTAETSLDLKKATRQFTTETMVDEDKIKTEEDIIESTSQLSFHGSEGYLPNVKIETKNEAELHITAQNKMTKHEAEMQKLIAEVEAKMKKSSVKNVDMEEKVTNNFNIDFRGTSHEENVLEKEEVENNLDKEDAVRTWKPTNFGHSKTDFEEPDEAKTFVKDVKNEPNEEEIIQEKTSEINENVGSENEESNVPVFINTWQNWLKLNPEPTVIKENVKQKAIENFIEREPRISKLKEESNFTVKDKGDNILHLMTETLANLYLDQKLYTKAQKAFELLIEKEPEKAERFREKLQKIKELRNQK